MNALLRRLDAASWNRVHTAITAALGIGWLLDAFEVTIVNNVIGTLRDLWRLTSLQASWILSVWFVGIIVGAYLFGYLADRFGRRRLFLLTLLLYGLFTFLTAFARGYGSFMALRLLTAVSEPICNRQLGLCLPNIFGNFSDSFAFNRHRRLGSSGTHWCLYGPDCFDCSSQRSRLVSCASAAGRFLDDWCHGHGAVVFPRRGGKGNCAGNAG